MGLQALIFDVDGTVAETADLHRAAFNEAFAELGIGWHWDRAIYSQLAPVAFDLPKLRLFALATRRVGAAHVPSATKLAAIASRKAQLYCKSVRQGAARLRPGVARLINEARFDGLSIAAVSTSSRAETEALISATLGFHSLGWFNNIQTSENAGAPSCIATLYRLSLGEMGISPDRAIAIGDSETSNSAAARSGLKTIVTPSLYTSSNRFIDAALVISDLGQPNQPFTVLRGETSGQGFVTPALLHQILAPKAAAA